MAKKTPPSDTKNSSNNIADFDDLLQPEIPDSDRYVDSGSYILNALLSGSIYKGFLGNKVVGLAGDEATGKTFFLLEAIRAFLDNDPTALAIVFESEAAYSKMAMAARGIDVSRVKVSTISTVEEFKNSANQVLRRYSESGRKYRLLLGLDSIGMLSTEKEMNDAQESNNVVDMTKAKVLKAAFRTLTPVLGKLDVPLIATNHTYASPGNPYAGKEMGGGSALKYAATTILYLSKKIDRDKSSNEVVGDIIHCRLKKSRITKPNKVVDVYLDYDRGLNRYYGLAPLAAKYGIFTKLSTQYQLPDGTKVHEKKLNREPERYYTKEILDRIDEVAAKEFEYGGGLSEGVFEDGDDDLFADLSE